MCDFCEKYINVSCKHGIIRLGAENYMLFCNSEKGTIETTDHT